MKNNIATVIVFAILLSGCSSLVFKTTEVKEFHPQRPLPIVLQVPEWKLLTPDTCEDILGTGTCTSSSEHKNTFSYMALSWEDYLLMGQNMQVIIRGLKEYNSLLCHYRKDLKEAECVPYLPVEE